MGSYKVWDKYLNDVIKNLFVFSKLNKKKHQHQMSEKISITFDEENRIRVLEADKFQDTEAMKNESMEFIKSNILARNLINLNHRNHLF